MVMARAAEFIGPAFIGHVFLGCSLAVPGCGDLAEPLGTRASTESRTWAEF
jgi:hypothetical protein